MRRLMFHILVGILGIWLATGLPKVSFEGEIASLALAGFVLGVINFFFKPILDILTFPLKILTFGLFTLLMNMGIIWIIDILILGNIFTLLNLFLTTIIIWILNIIIIKK